MDLKLPLDQVDPWMMNGQHVLDAPSYGESKKDKVLNRQNNVRDALKTIAGWYHLQG